MKILQRGSPAPAGPPLAAVDDVVIALALDAGLDVGGIGRGHRRLGHREGAADLALQQRLEPLPVVLGRAVAGDGLHVAGIGRRAVEDLARPGHRTHDLGQRRIFLVGQAHAVVQRRAVLLGLGRQEQVPQAGGACLGLELLDRLQRRPAATGGGIGLDLGPVGRLGRVDMLGHEGLQARLQVLHAGGIGKVHRKVSSWGVVSSGVRPAARRPSRVRPAGAWRHPRPGPAHWPRCRRAPAWRCPA